MLNISELVLNGKQLDLTEIYRDKDIKTRIAMIQSRFQEEYENKAKYLNRSPGRVNLIGEHIDYNGYGVLPFAIEKDCIILSAENEKGLLRISHRYKDKYEKKQMSLEKVNDMKDDSHLIKDGVIEYWQYIVAGIKSVLGLGYQLKKGIDIMIDGDIPLGSGLSSSSALTCCGSIVGVTMVSQYEDVKVGRNDYILGVIDGERKLGIACGGMDQTISLMGQTDMAMFIQFEPQLELQNVQISDQVSFVVANSMTQSIKSQASYKQYNMRVVECKIALYLLIKYVNQYYSNDHDYFKINNLADLQAKLNKTVEQMVELIEECFQGRKQDMRLEEISNNIGNEVQLDQLINKVQNYKEVLQKNELFGIYSRIKHVINEYKRVRDFMKLCVQKVDCKDDQNQIIQQMGQLMNQSQQSCKDLYECSSDNIDKLMQIGQKEGMLGGRLTGAGWGGCVIFMVYKCQVNQFIDALNQQFYCQLGDDQDNDLQPFSCQPTRGALSVLLDSLSIN